VKRTLKEQTMNKVTRMAAAKDYQVKLLIEDEIVGAFMTAGQTGRNIEFNRGLVFLGTELSKLIMVAAIGKQGNIHKLDVKTQVMGIRMTEVAAKEPREDERIWSPLNHNGHDVVYMERLELFCHSIEGLGRCEPATFDDDVRVDYFRHAGQGVNEDARCARVTHLPTGIYVDSQEDVTRRENLVLAMEKLDARINWKKTVDDDRAIECVANQLVNRIIVDVTLKDAVDRGIIDGYDEPVEVRPGEWEVDAYCAPQKPAEFIKVNFKHTKE
jgi:hypothetical protein